MNIKPRSLLFITCLGMTCFAPVAAGAGDISTHSFIGCAFPDTNQRLGYTSTPGEDRDYSSTVSLMSFTVHNGVDWGGTATSSVTVDNRTGLMWVTNPADAGISGTYTWENALSACEGLTYAGFSDWRLPNVRELMSIVDYGVTSDPRINTAYFLNTASSYYWTSTTYTPASTNVWYVYFDNGSVFVYFKTNNSYVRCVRGGP